MRRNKKISLLFISVMIISMLVCTVSATDFSETTVKHDFNPVDFVFSYSDGNTTEYKGDTGLKGAYCRNTVDNLTYWLPDENVRGIAYATKKTFKFNDNIDITHSLSSSRNDYAYIVLKMYYKNGTEIRTLDISDTDLTKDEKSYFDNYESQKQDYYNKQYADELDSIENNQENQIKNQNNHKSGYFVGTRGAGYYHSF